jgi:hypothetical protein
MNPMYLHLLFNHLSPIGTVFCFLLLSAGVLAKNQDWIRAALGAAVIVALLAWPAYLTGEPAAEGLKRFGLGDGEVVERHEESAESSFVASQALGVIALAGLFAWRKRPVPKWFALGCLAAALAVAGMLGWTADLGGQIRHIETGRSLTAPRSPGSAPPGDVPSAGRNETEPD